jgi:hypothetical protein
MSFTPIGIFIIIIGLLAFVYSTKWLFGFTIFFIPFTATAVINFGAEDIGSSVQPYMFLAVLCVLKSVFVWVVNKKCNIKPFSKNEFFIQIFLLLFVLITGISLIMPGIINGKIYGNIKGDLGEAEQIKFSTRNITQYLYFLQGISFLYVINFFVSKREHFIFAIKIFSYSIIFVMAWGIFEFLCKKFSIPYPAAIFNNSFNGTTKGYTGLLESGGTRIASVAAEPSILAQVITAYLPFVLVSIEQKTYIFSRWKDWCFVIAIILFTFLTTSSSGILCIFATCFFFIISKKKSLNKRIRNLFILLAVLAICIPIAYFIFTDLINSLLLDKADSYSALQRLDTITSGWNNFLQYPLLGVGWGSVTVNDLIIKILSNTGIIALICFISALYFIIKRHMAVSDVIKKDTINRYLNKASVLSLSVLLFNCEIAGFSFYYGIFWLILGFCMVDKNKFVHDN